MILRGLKDGGQEDISDKTGEKRRRDGTAVQTDCVMEIDPSATCQPSAGSTGKASGTQDHPNCSTDVELIASATPPQLD